MQYLRQSTAGQSVLIGPFVDSTTGVTAETGLTIANTDIRLSANGGNMAAKNSGGGTHDEAGWYTITLDATDSATVGRLQLSVAVSGALPVFAEFQVLEEAIYDALFAASATGALPATLVQGGINTTSGTITTLDALDTAQDSQHSTTQELIGNIAVGSAGISTTAGAFVKSGSEPETNTYTATHQLDGIYHIVEDVGNATDAYYQFDIGPNGIPVEFEWTGYALGKGDTYSIFAYNYGTTSYDQIGTIDGTQGTTVQSKSFSMLVAHVGTGANDGLVRFRFTSANGAAIATDRLLATYTISNAALGYENGWVWVDESAGTSTGTTPGVDGLVTNRCDDFDNAQAIAASLGYTSIYVTKGNSITLTAPINNYAIGVPGGNWTVALGGQDIGECDFYYATVTGIGTGTSVQFHNCSIGVATLPPCGMLQCGIRGTLTLGSAGAFRMIDCYGDTDGASAPVIDMGAAVGATTLEARRWSGSITLNNLAAGDVVSLDGTFGTITLNGADATVEIRGIYKALTNNLTGTQSVTASGVKGTDVADILVDTAEIGTSGAGLTAVPWNASWDAEVQSEVNDGLVAFWTSPATLVDLIWDEPQSGHVTASTFGVYLDAAVSSASAPTAAAVADAVWEEAITDHSGTPGSVAEALNAAGSAGDPWTTALPGSYTGSQAGKIMADILTDTGSTLQSLITDLPADILTNMFVDSNWTDLVGDVTEILLDTGTTLPATLSTLATTSQMNARTLVSASYATATAQATAQADLDLITGADGVTLATSQGNYAPATVAALATVDTNVDTLITQLTTDVAEPGVPGATATVPEMIATMYGATRNKITVTSSSKAFFNDAGTQVWAKALSDDGTTYTEAEGA